MEAIELVAWPLVAGSTATADGSAQEYLGSLLRVGSSMTVEILYFEGCPSHEALLPRLRELASETDTEIQLRRVESLEAAERERFLGSPTVRVGGADVEPGAADRTDFGLKCRIYRSNGSVSPTPPDEWVRSALAGSVP